jgi:hypothetical protein
MGGTAGFDLHSPAGVTVNAGTSGVHRTHSSPNAVTRA